MTETSPKDKELVGKVSGVKVEVSSTPTEDIFWIELAKSSIRDTIQVMDERAKYVITTCASLIVIHFGLLLAFEQLPEDKRLSASAGKGLY